MMSGGRCRVEPLAAGEGGGGQHSPCGRGSMNYPIPLFSVEDSTQEQC